MGHTASIYYDRLGKWQWGASGILEIIAFFSSAIRMWAALGGEPRKRSSAASLLVVVSLDGSMKLANGAVSMTAIRSFGLPFPGPLVILKNLEI